MSVSWTLKIFVGKKLISIQVRGHLLLCHVMDYSEIYDGTVPVFFSPKSSAVFVVSSYDFIEQILYTVLCPVININQKSNVNS